MNRKKKKALLVLSITTGVVTMVACVGILWMSSAPGKDSALPVPMIPEEGRIYAPGHLAELYKDEPIKVDYVYAFATPPGAKTGAVFATIYNQADTQDFLIKAESKVAEHTELHESYVDPDDQTMMMRKVRNIEIPEGYDEVLVPGGYHVMLINLYQPLIQGATFTIDLTFEKAGKISVPVTITPPGVRLEPMDENELKGEPIGPINEKMQKPRGGLPLGLTLPADAP